MIAITRAEKKPYNQLQPVDTDPALNTAIAVDPRLSPTPSCKIPAVVPAPAVDHMSPLRGLEAATPSIEAAVLIG